MKSKYYVVITDKGRTMIAQAMATKSTIELTHMAVGDSNGHAYDPESSMTELKHETYRNTISSCTQDLDQPNLVKFEFTIPVDSGGYFVREAALFAKDGTMVAIAKLPEQYKSTNDEGAGQSLAITLVIAVNSEAKALITVPSSVNYVTQKGLDKVMKEHVDHNDPHTIYRLKSNTLVLSDLYYIVDSQDTFESWLNNKDNDLGKKYERILIKEGVYNSTKALNLTTTKTKSIEGVGKVEINFSNIMTENNNSSSFDKDKTFQASCLYYGTKPDVNDKNYYIKNIKVTSTNDKTHSLTIAQSYSVYSNVIANCVNLDSVTAINKSTLNVDITTSNSGYFWAVSFHQCDNMVRCSIENKSSTIRSGYGSGYGYGYGYGYSSCTSLTNCSGDITATSENNYGDVHVFSSCKRVVGCYAKGTSKHGSNCTSSQLTNGYVSCHQVSDCIAEVSANYKSSDSNTKTCYGFNDCKQVNNCVSLATYTNSGSGSPSGYAYYNCKLMSHNGLYKSSSTTGSYSSCYADSSTGYSVADNSSGGFNTTSVIYS